MDMVFFLISLVPNDLVKSIAIGCKGLPPSLTPESVEFLRFLPVIEPLVEELATSGTLTPFPLIWRDGNLIGGRLGRIWSVPDKGVLFRGGGRCCCGTGGRVAMATGLV